MVGDFKGESVSLQSRRFNVYAFSSSAGSQAALHILPYSPSPPGQGSLLPGSEGEKDFVH